MSDLQKRQRPGKLALFAVEQAALRRQRRMLAGDFNRIPFDVPVNSL